jgi:hypothetical protein
VQREPQKKAKDALRTTKVKTDVVFRLQSNLLVREEGPHATGEREDVKAANRPKEYTAEQMIEVFGEQTLKRCEWIAQAITASGGSDSTAGRRIRELVESGKVCKTGDK